MTSLVRERVETKSGYTTHDSAAYALGYIGSQMAAIVSGSPKALAELRSVVKYLEDTK
jgi:hypothetical protein